MRGKFWSDRMRGQRAHLFWTMVECWPKEEDKKVGRTGRPGCMSVSFLERLPSC